MDIKLLISLSNDVINRSKQYSMEREILKDLIHPDKTLIGLQGARGSGKTVLLGQLTGRLDPGIFIALDSLDSEENIFELVRDLAKNYGYKYFMLDEVHFNKSINKSLKLIYDFLDVKVYFSSSVAIAMQESAHDLSRRVKLIKIPNFSFREFVELKTQARFSINTFKECLQTERKDLARFEYLFKEYLNGGCLPFALDTKDWRSAQENIIEKVITQDIPRISKITLDETDEIKKLLKHLLLQSMGDQNPSHLSNQTGIKRHRVSVYLELLEKSFLIKQVWPTGKNVLREPKIQLKLPLRLLNQDFEKAIGGLREDYAVECFNSSKLTKLSFNYLKNNRGKKTPDFLVTYNSDQYIIEIGGQSKSTSQFKGIKDNIPKYIFKEGAPYTEYKLPLVNLGGLY